MKRLSIILMFISIGGLLLMGCSKSHMITFNTNGGSEIKQMSVNTLKKPKDPIKEGHRFLGWFKDESLTTPFSFDEEISSSLTVYAKWAITEYKISFESNGGNLIETKFVKYNELLAYVEPIKERYMFLGWFKDESFNTPFSFDEAIKTDLLLYAKWVEDYRGFTFSLTDAGYVVTGYEGDGKNLFIPSTYEDKPVISIGDKAFFNQAIDSIFIPKTIQTIGQEAFSQSTLKEVTIEAGSLLETIAADAFSYVNFLPSISIPNSVTTIAERAFYEAGALKEVIINQDSQLETIGQYAFLNTHLEAIYLPETIKVIGQRTFYFCNSLYIYTMLNDIPDGWDTDFNPSNRPIRFGYTEETWFIKTLEESIIIPGEVSEDISLPKTIKHNNILYDITYESNDEAISVTGQVTRQLTDTLVTLTATVETTRLSHTLTFDVLVLKKEAVNPFIKPHQFVELSENMNKDNFVDVHYQDGYLMLVDGKLEGYYESEIFRSERINKLVASWSAITSQDATVELAVKVRVSGVWSKYFSYQPWGFGLNNKSVNTSDSIASLSVDELIILNNKSATAFQYKLTLRKSASALSPKVKLVAMALTLLDHTYQPSIESLPNFVDYDVPKLNQQAVPTIGSSICSPTSSTMLLMHKGHDFSSYDTYPHKYIAERFKDYGVDIFGNWTFNTVGMSNFETAYVGKMYSYEELFIHLHNVGPVAASVRGNMGLYTTNGHLIVVRGYRINDNGDIFVIANDPNINSRFGNDKEGNPYFVYYEFPLSVFINTWNGMVYIVE